jgi:pimeloyl-ACP methyl ester carboxylesterase
MDHGARLGNGRRRRGACRGRLSRLGFRQRRRPVALLLDSRQSGVDPAQLISDPFELLLDTFHPVLHVFSVSNVRWNITRFKICANVQLPDIHEIAEMLVEANPNADKVIVEGAAHMGNMERPEEFNRLVMEFLEGLRIE